MIVKDASSYDEMMIHRDVSNEIYQMPVDNERNEDFSMDGRFTMT